jgi:hypothetical protein
MIHRESKRCLSDRANKNFRGWRDSFSMPQVIGNVEKTIIT